MYLDDNTIPDIKPKWWCWLWNTVSEHHYSSLAILSYSFHIKPRFKKNILTHFLYNFKRKFHH